MSPFFVLMRLFVKFSDGSGFDDELRPGEADFLELALFISSKAGNVHINNLLNEH